MGQKNYRQIVIVIICFVLVSILIHAQKDQSPNIKPFSLSQALSTIEGWEAKRTIELDQKVIESLELDDYLNQIYTNGQTTISLYVGYYLTAKKVGAAHSPLVCFPGQGWVVSDISQGSMKINDKTFRFATMVVTKAERKELVLYWFQAFDKTSAGTFFQKVNIFLAKYLNAREDNAFVRASIPMNGGSKKHSLHKIENFIRAFYPKFLKYVTSQT